MRRLFCLMAIIALAGCGSVGSTLVKSAVGGGPSLSANVQAGKTNSQTIGTTSVEENSFQLVRPQARRDINQSKDESSVKADQIQSVIVNEEQPINWPMVVGLILVPSPLGLLIWPLLLRYRYRLEKR